MKRLLILLLCSFMTIGAAAQYAVQNVPVLKGSRVFMEGEKIPNEAVAAYLASTYDDSVAEDWTKNRNAYKTGLGLTIAGSSVIWCGSLVFTAGLIAGAGTLITIPILGVGGVIVGDMEPAGDYLDKGMSAAELMINIGGCTALTGLAMLASGIPVMCVYKKKLNNMFQEYGSGLTYDVGLTFGPTNHGVGFALNF